MTLNGLKGLQMSLCVSNKLSEVIWDHLESFKSWGDKISYTINMQCLLSFFCGVSETVHDALIQNQDALALTFFNLIKLIIRQRLRCQMDSNNFTSGYVNYLEVIFQNKWKKGIWKQQKHHQALSMFGYSTPLLWTLNREISWKGYIWNLCM